jgi:hypothetical protein
MASTRSRGKEVKPTGIEQLDRLSNLPRCSVADYVGAASEYVRRSRSLSDSQKKAGQIRLSNALGRALLNDLETKLPRLSDVVVGERVVSGALRTVNADVSEIHAIDGLRLAIELKPVNLAVGRAIWNRFGDIRTFAVNLHLKFPFCVIGGVLAIPTYEDVGTREAEKASKEEAAETVGAPDADMEPESKTESPPPGRKSTRHLISRAISRLRRAGGRQTEADAPHLLEGIAVLVYDPDTATIDPDLPPAGSGLRWEEFIATVAETYDARFED